MTKRNKMRPPVPAGVTEQIHPRPNLTQFRLADAKVDHELASFTPALTVAQVTAIEDMAAHGVRPRAYVFIENGTPTLLSNPSLVRLETERGVVFDVLEVPLHTRAEAMEHILAAELAEPERTKAQRLYTAGRLYKSMTRPGAPRQNGDQLPSEKVAARFGMSKRQVERASQLVAAVDDLAAAHGPAARRVLLDRGIVGDRLQRLHALPPAEQASAIGALQAGNLPDVLKKPKTATQPAAASTDALDAAVATLNELLDGGRVDELDPERRAALTSIAARILAQSGGPCAAGAEQGTPAVPATMVEPLMAVQPASTVDPATSWIAPAAQEVPVAAESALERFFAARAEPVTPTGPVIEPVAALDAVTAPGLPAESALARFFARAEPAPEPRFSAPGAAGDAGYVQNANTSGVTIDSEAPAQDGAGPGAEHLEQHFAVGEGAHGLDTAFSPGTPAAPAPVLVPNDPMSNLSRAVARAEEVTMEALQASRAALARFEHLRAQAAAGYPTRPSAKRRGSKAGSARVASRGGQQ